MNTKIANHDKSNKIITAMILRFVRHDVNSSSVALKNDFALTFYSTAKQKHRKQNSFGSRNPIDISLYYIITICIISYLDSDLSKSDYR